MSGAYWLWPSDPGIAECGLHLSVGQVHEKALKPSKVIFTPPLTPSSGRA